MSLIRGMLIARRNTDKRNFFSSIILMLDNGFSMLKSNSSMKKGLAAFAIACSQCMYVTKKNGKTYSLLSDWFTSLLVSFVTVTKFNEENYLENIASFFICVSPVIRTIYFLLFSH